MYYEDDINFVAGFWSLGFVATAVYSVISFNQYRSIQFPIRKELTRITFSAENLVTTGPFYSKSLPAIPAQGQGNLVRHSVGNIGASFALTL